MAISSIAEATRAELIQAAFDNAPVAVDTSSTEVVTILAGKAGHKAAVFAYDLTSGASDSLKLVYGSSNTDLTGNLIGASDTVRVNPNDLLIYAAPDGEDLKFSSTISNGINGTIQVAYVKVRD